MNSPDGKRLIIHPDEILVLVNKERSLPSDYAPRDLVQPDVRFGFAEDSPRRFMRAEAARALERLFARAAEQGVDLVAQSGYRSYETQESIHQYHVRRLGEEEARRVSALPGQSEHQTGLAMDVSAKSVDCALVEEFGETREGRWLAEHAPAFGFIIRYPRGAEDITGYSYEPWHLRYVGEEHTRRIAESGLTLEEYLISLSSSPSTH